MPEIFDILITLWEKEKKLVTSIFSFPSVFKSFLAFRSFKIVDLYGNCEHSLAPCTLTHTRTHTHARTHTHKYTS